MKTMLMIKRNILIVVLIIISAGCNNANQGAAPGTIAGDFRLDTLTHERFYLNQYRGRVVLLIFWTTWCSQCKKELTGIKELLEGIPAESLVVGAVCSDPENINDLKSIVSGWNIDYPVLLDKDGALFKKYRLRGFPTTMVIDRDGKTAMIRNGYSPLIMKQIEGKIKELL